MTDTERLRAGLSRLNAQLGEMVVEYQGLIARGVAPATILPGSMKADLERQLAAFIARAGLKVGSQP